MQNLRDILTWVVGIGIPVLFVLGVISVWRRAQNSKVWRFVFCFVIAGFVIPITFNNGHSTAWTIPGFIVLLAMFSGDHELLLAALRLFGLWILPVSLVLFGIWTAVISVRNKKQ